MNSENNFFLQPNMIFSHLHHPISSSCIKISWVLGQIFFKENSSYLSRQINKYLYFTGYYQSLFEVYHQHLYIKNYISLDILLYVITDYF